MFFKLNEFLDTNIYELLTGVSSRQEIINAFNCDTKTLSKGE